GRHLTSQTHRFKWDGSSPRKRVEHSRRATRVCLPNLLSEPVEARIVLAAPMQYSASRFSLGLLDQAAVNSLLFDGFDHLSGKATVHIPALVRIFGVRKERSDQSGAACRERPPRRPDVQGRDVSVPYIFFVN